MDHLVYSFDAATGTLLWKSPDLGGALVSTPAVGTDNVLYVGTFGKEMIALDASSGRILWRFTTQDWIWSGPSLANNVLYFGDLSGYLYALKAADGTTLWRIQPNNSIVDTPVVLGDKLYFTTEADTLYIVSTTGDIVNSKMVGGLIYSSPVITGETILVAPTNFTSLLVAMNLDGNQKWMFTPAK
jgi:outer membrane protein assembly factor BamB